MKNISFVTSDGTSVVVTESHYGDGSVSIYLSRTEYNAGSGAGGAGGGMSGGGGTFPHVFKAISSKLTAEEVMVLVLALTNASEQDKKNPPYAQGKISYDNLGSSKSSY